MISHRHGTIFVHVPKCGGTSIEQAFLADLGLAWEARAPLLMGPNDDPGRGPPRLGHLTAEEYVALGHVTAELFARYFSFALVRDPVARAVSLFNYLPQARSLDQFLLLWLPRQFRVAEAYATPGRAYPRHYWFVRPQAEFVDTGATPPLDAVIRLEELAERLPEIRARSGLVSPVGQARRSVAKARADELEPVHLRMIDRLYAGDFARFGYERPMPADGWPDDIEDQIARRAAAARRREALRRRLAGARRGAVRAGRMLGLAGRRAAG